MFTGQTIDLLTLANGSGFKVERDCQLSYIGKVPSTLPRRFVPCNAAHHIDAALELDGIVGIVTTPDNAHCVPEHLGLLIADAPVAAALELHEKLCGMDDFLWCSFESRIHPTATIHPTAIIAEHDVDIGAHTTIGPGAIIMPRTVIEDDCVVGPGSVIGCDAFEVNTHTAPSRILSQAGGVHLHKNVEILAKCTIVRATFGGFTTLGEATKLDCQVHVAHDCNIGQNVRIAACAEVSGRVFIGDHSFIGPNCSISNGLTLGQKCHVTIGAVVVRDVPDNGRVTGNFAVDHRKHIAHIKQIR